MFNTQRCVARETTDIIRGPGGGRFSLPEIIPFTSQGFFFTSFVYPDLSPRPRPELGPHKRGHQNDPQREWGGEQDLSVSGKRDPRPLVARCSALCRPQPPGLSLVLGVGSFQKGKKGGSKNKTSAALRTDLGRKEKEKTRKRQRGHREVEIRRVQEKGKVGGKRLSGGPLALSRPWTGKRLITSFWPWWRAGVVGTWGRTLRCHHQVSSYAPTCSSGPIPPAAGSGPEAEALIPLIPASP